MRQEDLLRFQAAHFPGTGVSNVSVVQGHGSEQQGGTTLEGRQEAYGNEDDLGYYEDGVKRTLTDEQIEIFRHSEIHSLLRDRQRLRDEEEEDEDDEEVDANLKLERSQELLSHEMSKDGITQINPAIVESTSKRKHAEEIETSVANSAVKRTKDISRAQPAHNEVATDSQHSKQNSSSSGYSAVRKLVSYADD